MIPFQYHVCNLGNLLDRQVSKKDFDFDTNFDEKKKWFQKIQNLGGRKWKQICNEIGY